MPVAYASIRSSATATAIPVPIAAAGPATEFTIIAARQLARRMTPHRTGSLAAELSDLWVLGSLGLFIGCSRRAAERLSCGRRHQHFMSSLPSASVIW